MKNKGKEVTDYMDREKILAAVDHTLLSPDATWDEIREVCDDGIKYNVASVCIPPSFVRPAAAYAAGSVKICTVVGFPCGYNTTEVKVKETAEAVRSGADEIDMVINLGWLKSKNYDDILCEIRSVKAACNGRPLKVIIETCLLSEQEKIKMCEIVSSSGADYIKTSTGFSSGGATKDDIILFSKHIDGIKIKAAGGIKSFEDAKEFINLGADRLGTSRLVKIMKESERAK